MTAAGPRGVLALVAWVNLGCRFVVELGAYAALAAFGAGLDSPLGLRIVTAVALPGVAIALWCLFLSPKARWRLGDPAAIVCEMAVFGGAASALAVSGSRSGGQAVVLAFVLVGVGCGNAIALRVLGLRDSGAPGSAPGGDRRARA